ncbi:MAG: hypothetical protein ABIH24_08465 [Verrucomicrobiota bacterium]
MRFETRLYFISILLFSVLLCPPNSPSAEVPGAAPDYSKWQSYDSDEPKPEIAIESVEIPVSEPTPVVSQKAASPRRFPGNWRVLKEKLMVFLGLQKSKPAPPQGQSPATAPATPVRKTIMRVKTPGKKRLEGVKTDLTILPQNRYLISCKVMGEGRVMLSVYRGGWVYGPKQILSADWQDAELEFFTEAAVISPNLLLVSDKPQACTLNLSDFKIERIKAPEMPDVEMAPVRFEAERYPAGAPAGKLVKDKSAGGGAYMEGQSHFWLAENVPLPQTGRPFYVYLRVMANNAGMQSINLIYRKSVTEIFARAAIPATEKWVWVRTGPLSYKIGERFLVSADCGNKDAVARLDSIVMAPRDDLSEIELDRIIPNL